MLQVASGGSAEFTCDAIVHGAPETKTTWTHSNVDSAFTPQQGSRLVLSDLSAKDAGMYVCTVETSGGKVERQVTLQVLGEFYLLHGILVHCVLE